jgi:hypothetical protein
MIGCVSVLNTRASMSIAAQTCNSALEAGFRNPGNEARPRAYWNWLNGDVSLPGLTRDLEEAKAKGLGGLEMWDTEAMRNPGGFVPAGPPFMSPESVAAMHHSMKVAKRLGLELGLITSSGWNAGGSWVPPAMASKNLFYAGVVLSGPGPIQQKLPFPEVPPGCPKGKDGLPAWYRDVVVLAWPDAEDKVIPTPSDVVDLTSHFKEGELTWTVPGGRWQVMRFVCSNNGQRLIAASPNSKGLFIDFLDPEATRFHFEYIINKLGIPKDGDPGNPLKQLEVDSMELHPGIQWTPKFPDWFEKYHGYDPVSWLPVLAGWTVTDKQTSDRFHYDYRKTVSDLLIFSHYTTGSEVCGEYGLQLAGEAGGPGAPIWSTCPVDALKALGNVDIPRGEFWIRHRNMFLVKEIASAAHIYGKPYVDAEAWTTWRRWKDSPFIRKQIVDRAFCEGLNRITYHGFSHSPEEVGYPGRTYHAGVDMNPQVAWWSKARPFMDYLARCCHMLQQGLFVADVAHYYGDQAPNFWPLFHNVPEKPLLPGLGAGYDYDVVNTDVILNRMSVKDGRIALHDGMSYRVLALPDQRHMPLEVLVKLEQMVSAGATVIGPKPVEVPGLRDAESQTDELRALADRMWGPCDGKTVKQNRYGKGRVVWGLNLRQWLEEQSIGPDFVCMTQQHRSHLDYIHRQTDDADIYFVRNKSLQPVQANCLFRVSDAAPQLWDPTDGNIEPVFAYKREAGATNVRLDLPPGGSVFVVFGEQQPTRSVESVARVPDTGDAGLPAERVIELAETSAVIQCFQNGQYAVTDRKGQEGAFKVASLPAPLTLEGEWTVEFDPEWGAPARVVFPKLMSWTDHEDEGIKYYSGTGLYSRTLDVPAEWLASGREVHLDLGDVRELAEVFVNGKPAGILWKAPFRLEITTLLKPGGNELKIEAVNLWINRLVGDMKLPQNKKFCRTNMTPYMRSIGGDETWKVQPAGLLGPVRVLPAARVTVDMDGMALPPLEDGGIQMPKTDANHPPVSASTSEEEAGAQLLGNRFFTLNTVVRVNQIETSRDGAHGRDESSIHSPKEARAFREAVETGWPGARITWAFSWRALKDERPNYRNLRELIVSYHREYGDEITFIPGGYFANMYNTCEQVSRDLHDGLQMVSDLVGGGYRPQAVVAGFLSAKNQKFLAEEEGIHVCQGTIWSQYAIDNGDGDGSLCYPYYPSREHFCKPAQGNQDFIDCVNLDGWTVNFANARYAGMRPVNSRQGVGPIETFLRFGTEEGLKEVLGTTAAHFETGFELNDFAWVTCTWELCLVEGRKIYGYQGRNGLDGLVLWLSEMRRRWPQAQCITLGEFGMLWREQFRSNDDINYRFVQRGSGVGGSDPDMEIRWFMNKDFRLALAKNLKEGTQEKVIDFTRYDLKAKEPREPKPGKPARNWSLMNRINQKQTRPEDKPIPFEELNADEQEVILLRYPELMTGISEVTP